VSDILGPELERLCILQNVDFGRDKFGNFVLHKNGNITTIDWRMVLSQHKPTVHIHHKDGCYFISDSYYNEDRHMDSDCDCPRTVIPANPLALAKSIIETLLQKTQSLQGGTNEC